LRIAKFVPRRLLHDLFHRRNREHGALDADRPGRWTGFNGDFEELIMANTKSAKKAVRKIATRTAVNKNRRSRMRTYVRKVEEAILAGDKTVAQEALKAAQPEVMRCATKGILHRNTASRKISRLSARVRAL
jgi:small subunit ribosomal protein S20